MSGEFDFFLKEHEIISKLSVLGILWQNEVTKIRNQTLYKHGKIYDECFLTLSISFWGYALETIGYLHYVVLSKLVPLTSMEMWIGRKPGLHHFCI